MEENRGRVIAFYSYKGGIGQSTTIAIVASLLVKWHRKVLLVDSDVDSIGLTAYVSDWTSTSGRPPVATGGLHALLRTIAGGNAANWRDFLLRATVDGSVSTLDILPGGNHATDRKHWSTPMDKSTPGETPGLIAYLEALRRDWCAEYDFILIDSKPPLAYADAMWTMRLADTAVVMVPTQEEIMQKTLAVVDQSLASFHPQSKHRDLRVVPVTARYDNAVANSVANGWVPQLVSSFQKYLQVWAPGIAATAISEKLKIQQTPEWNWRTPSAQDSEGPGRVFGSLARLIAHDFNWRCVDRNPAAPALVESSSLTAIAQLESNAEALYCEFSACREAGQTIDAILIAGMAISCWRRCVTQSPGHNAIIDDVRTFLLSQLRTAAPVVARAQAAEAAAVPIDRQYMAGLASVLSNLSLLLAQRNENDTALEVQQGSILIRRLLAGKWPRDYEVDLARSLHNYSKRLAKINDRAQAIAVAAEAVTIRRRWSRREPARYALPLARSLANLALRFNEGGQRQKALLAMRETVTILRHLARADVPHAQVDLARSLTTLASLLRANGDHRKSASTMWEAVRLWMRLRKEQALYSLDLALAFDNFSMLLATANEGLLAITAAERAVQLLRRLHAENRPGMEAYLARSLTNLSTRLASEGYTRRALAAAEESVQIRTRLAAADPVQHTADLALSLNNFSNRVAATGNWLKALEAIEKAVALRSELSAHAPKENAQDLAISLYNKSLRLIEADEAGLAIVAVEQSLANVRQLLTQDAAGLSVRHDRY